jgi:SAM-dependent methyltransferase
MNLEKFIEQLPHLYHDWGNLKMRPKSEGFQEIFAPVETEFNTNLLELLNLSVDCLKSEEIFCQIGCFRPHTLAAALWNHPETMAYGVENFSKFDPMGDKLAALSEEISQLNLDTQVLLCDQSLEAFYQDLQYLQPQEKIGIYYYDAISDYRSVLLGLLGIKNFLSESALLIVTNSKEDSVQQALTDFLLTHAEAFPLLHWQVSNHGILGLNNLCLLAWKPESVYQPLHIEKKIVLNVGSGPYRQGALPENFTTSDWQEIRLDIDPHVLPDMIGTITDLSAVADNSVDAVFSSHNLEHIYDYEVPLALGEFLRVLKPDGGLVMIVVPDMQNAAQWVARGDMDDEPLYLSPGGPVKALWMFYGMGTSVPGLPYMAHKTGFTAASLQPRLVAAGFSRVEVVLRPFEIVAYGYKTESAS